MIIHHNQVRFISGTQASISTFENQPNVIHHINRPYKQNHKDHLNSCQENHSTKSNTYFWFKMKWNKHTKTLSKTNEGYLLSKKSSASSTLNAEKFWKFSLFNWEPKMYILITSRKHLGDAAYYARKRNKKYTDWERRHKWFLFSDNLTVHRGNKKIPTKKKKAFRISTWI